MKIAAIFVNTAVPGPPPPLHLNFIGGAGNGLSKDIEKPIGAPSMRTIPGG